MSTQGNAVFVYTVPDAVTSDSQAPSPETSRPVTHIDLLTLFPRMVEGFLAESILGRAVENNLLSITVSNIRDWAGDKNKRVDDTPFGGGAGMVMTPQPLFDAIENFRTEKSQVVYLCPDGEPLTNDIARELSTAPHLILVSGHYEGIDQRVRDTLVTREISIGDYVLTNGTLAAAVLIDCLARQIPGVLGEENSLTGDSFTNNFLAFPQYTRPANFRGMSVPPVLLSGDHGAIARWRHEQQVAKTKLRRPDLFSKNKPT